MIFGALLQQFDSRMFQKAVEFFSHVLDIDGQSSVPVKIKVVDNIGRGKTGGTCSPEFDEDQKLIAVKIEIKQSVGTIGMIECLAHEMVHAKQWIKGEISAKVERAYIFGILPYFKVRKFWLDKEVTDLGYYEQPSEIEAHLLQRSLTTEFLKLIENKLDPIAMATLLNQSTESIMKSMNKEDNHV